MTKHTALTLAKYLGKKVWVEMPMGNPYFGLINEINIRDCVIWVIEEDETLNKIDGSLIKYVYPILKTVDDLVKEHPDYGNESKFFFTQNCCTKYWDCRHPVSIEEGMKMLKDNAGAIPSKESPTGYVSIFDNLPCKRWSEVFE